MPDFGYGPGSSYTPGSSFQGGAAGPGSSYQSQIYGPGDPFYNAPGPGPSTAFGSGSYVPSPYYGGGYGTAGTQIITGPAVPTSDYLSGQQQYGFNQALSAGMLQAAPQMAASQNARNLLAGQLGAENVSYGNQQGYLNANYGIGMAKNANAIAANQADIASNQAQLGINAVDIAANARQPGYLTTLQNIANQQYDVNRASNVAQNQASNFNLFNQAVGAGNVLTGGYGVQRADLAGQLMRAQQGVNLQQQGTTARFYENMAQVNDQAQRLGYTKQQIEDQGQKLELQANNLGIDKMQLANDLASGLDRLGLSHSTNVNDLLNRMNSTNINDAVLAQNTFNQAIANSDYYSRQYAGQNAAAGVGGPSTPEAKTYPGGFR